MSLVKLNDYVVIKKFDGTSFLKRVDENLKFKIFRTSIGFKSLVGKQYGAIFDLSKTPFIVNLPKRHTSLPPTADVGINNQPETDLGETLKTIKKLKKKEIKKAKKFQLLEATPFRVLASVLPKKVNFMRCDTFSKILLYGNIEHNSNVLVIDSTQGLLTSAINQRTNGTILSVLDFELTESVLKDSEILSFLKEKIKYNVLSNESQTEKKTKEDLGFDNKAVKGESKSVVEGKGDKIESPLNKTTSNDNRVEDRLKNLLRNAKKKKCSLFHSLSAEKVRNIHFIRRDNIEAVLKLENFFFDSLVVALKKENDEKKVLDLMWPFLKVNGYFVCFSIYIEPLSRMARTLKTEAKAVNVQIGTTLLFYQNIEFNRTRPSNRAQGVAGFLISAIKLMPNSE